MLTSGKVQGIPNTDLLHIREVGWCLPEAIHWKPGVNIFYGIQGTVAD